MKTLQRKLTDFEMEVLANLPIEPTGLSMEELAEGLLDNRGPVARGLIRKALDAIVDALGGLYAPLGDDDLGNFGVLLYGIRQVDAGAVRRFCDEWDVYR